MASLLDDAKAQIEAELLASLQGETPTMVRMGLATSAPPEGAGRSMEDIRLLRQALEQEQSRMETQYLHLGTLLSDSRTGSV